MDQMIYSSNDKDNKDCLAYVFFKTFQEQIISHPYYSEIAKRIERARIEKGITKYRLALELNMSAAYLSRIERGVSTLSVKTLMQICDALGVPESYILRGD